MTAAYSKHDIERLEAEIERLRRVVMEISSRYLNPRAVGRLTEPAPQPCADLTVQELLEWLRQPQYTNGRLDEHAAEHMVSAATLIERLAKP